MGVTCCEAMDELGAILDITHQSDTSFWESMALFKGPRCSPRTRTPARWCREAGNSVTTQLKALIERDAVVGPALDNWMLYPDCVRGETPNTLIHLTDYVEHIDRICQLAGVTHATRRSVSDLDGGYGWEQTPEGA